MIKVNLLALATAMANACMSVEELADAAGFSRATIYNIRKGKSARPENVGRIAKVLNVDAKELIESVVLERNTEKERRNGIRKGDSK